MKEELIADCKRQIEYFEKQIVENTNHLEHMKFILSALESFNT